MFPESPPLQVCHSVILRKLRDHHQPLFAGHLFLRSVTETITSLQQRLRQKLPLQLHSKFRGPARLLLGPSPPGKG